MIEKLERLSSTIATPDSISRKTRGLTPSNNQSIITLLNQGSCRISILRLWTIVGRWPSVVVKHRVWSRRARSMWRCLRRLIRDKDALTCPEKLDIVLLWYQIAMIEGQRRTEPKRLSDLRTELPWSAGRREKGLLEAVDWDWKRQRSPSLVGMGILSISTCLSCFHRFNWAIGVGTVGSTFDWIPTSLDQSASTN